MTIFRKGILKILIKTKMLILNPVTHLTQTSGTTDSQNRSLLSKYCSMTYGDLLVFHLVPLCTLGNVSQKQNVVLLHLRVHKPHPTEFVAHLGIFLLHLLILCCTRILLLYSLLLCGCQTSYFNEIFAAFIDTNYDHFLFQQDFMHPELNLQEAG